MKMCKHKRTAFLRKPRHSNKILVQSVQVSYVFEFEVITKNAGENLSNQKHLLWFVIHVVFNQIILTKS